jgi:hypothetical protein
MGPSNLLSTRAYPLFTRIGRNPAQRYPAFWNHYTSIYLRTMSSASGLEQKLNVLQHYSACDVCHSRRGFVPVELFKSTDSRS